jgi:hypothetical protein
MKSCSRQQTAMIAMVVPYRINGGCGRSGKNASHFSMGPQATKDIWSSLQRLDGSMTIY